MPPDLSRHMACLVIGSDQRTWRGKVAQQNNPKRERGRMLIRQVFHRKSLEVAALARASG